jgi:hypothetical protein
MSSVQTRSLRLAILTSLGLIPLACFGGRAADAVADTDSENATTVPGPVDQTPEYVNDESDRYQPTPTATTTPTPPIELANCGASTPLLAEDAHVYYSSQTRPLSPGTETGLYRCDNGLLHRPEAAACSSRLPRELPPAPDADAGAYSPTQVEQLYGIRLHGDPTSTCTQDADCTEHALGFCAPVFADFPTPTETTCRYGCLSDGDCAADQFCLCGDPVGECVAATCRTDQDCGGELKCASWSTYPVCGTYAQFACQTPDDECNSAADCPVAGPSNVSECNASDGTRRCVQQGLSACGRPFLVAGEARLAALCSSRDWASSGAAAPDELLAPERLLIGEHWARAALMEHASIAAFARFTLQLLHLGAPRELLEQSQQAMLDETEHAKLCFSLASRYLDAAVGPGALPMDDALAQNELGSVTLMAFLEGCVGETVATLEARAALEQASDPQVRSALSRIAADEQRHAELAWRFVRWALTEDADLAALLALELERLSSELRDGASGVDLGPLAAHGVLSGGGRARVRRAALAEVVLPCGQALLAAHSGCLKMPSRAACQITATAG